MLKLMWVPISQYLWVNDHIILSPFFELLTCPEVGQSCTGSWVKVRKKDVCFKWLQITLKYLHSNKKTDSENIYLPT